jgi:hypothetical protein
MSILKGLKGAWKSAAHSTGAGVADSLKNVGMESESWAAYDHGVQADIMGEALLMGGITAGVVGVSMMKKNQAGTRQVS